MEFLHANKPHLLKLLYLNQVHKGHSVETHSDILPFIGLNRYNFWVINLNYTRVLLKRSLSLLNIIFRNNGHVIFVGTRPSWRKEVRKLAIFTKQSYVTQKWVGGLLTNPSVVKQIKQLNKRFDKSFKAKNRRDILLYKRYKNLFYGLRNLNKKPDLIFIFNVEDNLNVIKEAHKANIPVMCILDTNISIKNIAYPIPGNDDDFSAFNLYLNLIRECFSRSKEPFNSFNNQDTGLNLHTLKSFDRTLDKITLLHNNSKNE